MVLPNRMEPNMKSKAAISAIVAMSLITGSLAFAQGYGDRGERGRDEQAQRGGQQERRDNEGRRENRRDEQIQRRDQQERRYEGRQEERREYQRRANHDERRYERGAGPNHQFYPGERLPVEYRHRNYVVDDWRGHNLSAPPRGYHWVQTGGDYVLAAIATGIILQLFLRN